MRPYKGMRVFQPSEHRQLEHICNGWIKAATERGFQQYKTPIIDVIDLYTDKTSEEIMREQTYRFTDRGNREVILRPEITPGISNMVVEMQKKRKVRKPLKVFTIGSVFRYENTQKGRTREHIQYNADIFGESSVWADAEVIEVIFSVIEHVNLSKDDFEVRLNDRAEIKKRFNELVSDEKEVAEVLRLLDKRDAINEADLENNLKCINSSLSLSAIDDIMKEPGEQVKKVMEVLPDDIPAIYDPHTVRGFDYYTGIVFEVFAKDKKIAKRSVAGGGRYDRLIESYGGDTLPAVGFGMGDVVLADCLEAQKTYLKFKGVSIVVCAESEAVIEYAYSLSRDIRLKSNTHIHSVSFIGVVPEKKLGSVCKRHEKEGAQHTVFIGNDRKITSKELATRERKVHNSIKDYLMYIKTL